MLDDKNHLNPKGLDMKEVENSNFQVERVTPPNAISPLVDPQVSILLENQLCFMVIHDMITNVFSTLHFVWAFFTNDFINFFCFIFWGKLIYGLRSILQ